MADKAKQESVNSGWMPIQDLTSFLKLDLQVKKEHEVKNDSQDLVSRPYMLFLQWFHVIVLFTTRHRHWHLSQPARSWKQVKWSPPQKLVTGSTSKQIGNASNSPLMQLNCEVTWGRECRSGQAGTAKWYRVSRDCQCLIHCSDWPPYGHPKQGWSHDDWLLHFQYHTSFGPGIWHEWEHPKHLTKQWCEHDHFLLPLAPLMSCRTITG